MEKALTIENTEQGDSSMNNNKCKKFDDKNASAQLTSPTCKRKKSFAIKHWHQIALFVMIYDIFVVTGAYFIALWLRFD